MAKVKVYKFRDSSAFTHNKELIEAIGEASHVRQVSVVVAAPSKARALELLNAVGFGVNTSVVHLVLADSPRVTKWQEEGILTEGSVIASSLLLRTGSGIISLTPSEDKYKPVITRVATVS